MSKSRDIADSAATINFIDSVTSNVQTQLNTATAAIATNTSAISNISVTNGSLTKTFANGESASISLTSNVLVPVVSVTKEIAQSGTTNNSWDVNSTSQNYTRLDSAAATTLSWVGSPNLADTAYLTNVAATRDTVDIFMSPDGTQLYQFNDWNNELYQYTLSTAGDVSTKTASYTEHFYTNVTGVGNAIRGGFWKSDGTVLYLFSSSDIAQFTTSSAYSAGSVNGTNTGTRSLTSPHFVRISSDGTKILYMQSTGAVLRQRNMSTAWDVSTASASDDATFSLTSQMNSSVTLGGLHVSADGLTLYTAEVSSKTIYQWSFGTANDISTLTFVAKITANSSANTLRGLAFSSASKSFIHSDNETSPKMYGYSLSQALALGTGSFASADVGKTIEANSGAFVLTATTGSYSQVTAPTSFNQVASGSWEMFGVIYNTTDGDLELSNYYGGGYDIASASYASINFNPQSSQGTSPQSLRFNNDGSKMFIVAYGGQDVNEYTLSTNFNVSTATFVDAFSVGGQEDQPYGLAFSSDGTKMYVCGVTGDDINEYTLSTGFDISTSSYTRNFSVSSQENQPTGIAFNNDGTKMYVTGMSSDAINQYALSTAFNVSTASFAQAFSVGSQATHPTDVVFNSDGTVMIVACYMTRSIYKYALTTGFDVSTASYKSALDVSSVVDRPNGLAFNDTGSKMYITDGTTHYVYQYKSDSIAFVAGFQAAHTTASTDTTYWTDINSMTANEAAGDGKVLYCISTDDRTTWTVIKNGEGERNIVRNNGGTWQYNSAVGTSGGALSQAAYAGTGTISQSAFGASWANSGNLLFIASNTTDSIYKYTVSSAYDISTASESQSFSVSAKESVPTGIFVRADGLKFYVSGQGSNKVHEYTMSTAYDLSTASFTASLGTTTSNLTSVAFKEDGLKMYTINYSNSQVKYWTLSTAWDITTASYVSATSLPTKSAGCNDIFFNSTGTELYVDDNTDDKIYKYTLSTAWDVTSVSYTEDFSHATQLAQVLGMIFNADLTEMILLNATNWYKYRTSIESYTTNETWVNATTNTELATISQAMGSDAIGDIGNATYSSVNYSTGSFQPRGLFFSADGTKMFLQNAVSDVILRYTLTTAFDITTASADSGQSFSYGSQDGDATNFTLNADGTRLYVLGYTNKYVYQYIMTTAYDLTTASYNSVSLSVNSQDSAPFGITFNNDGTKLYVGGQTNDRIYAYTLTTGFDLSTASYSSVSLSVSAQDGAIKGMLFNNAGTKLYMFGTATTSGYEYSLTSAFDISTAIYESSSFSFASQDATPQGYAFKSDDTELFMVGDITDAVYKYSMISLVEITANQMNKAQLDAVTDPNHITLSNDFDLSIILKMTSGTTVPSSNGVSINYDASILNQGAVLGTDYSFDAPAQNRVRITALAANNLKVRVV
tara:strand:- start:106 stop:4341 length:4236 start_codon:yes stop_codon:yes gene_type:complete